jgi:hypothetical protein
MSGTSAILIGFNAGDYETIDLSQWIAANPKEVLATNFNKPAESGWKIFGSRCLHPRQGWCLIGQGEACTNTPAELEA